MKRYFMFTVILTFLILSFVSVSYAAQVNLTAVSASPGGGWYATMGALAEMIHQNNPAINIKSTPGSGAANALAVAMGAKAQIGFTFPAFAISARNGTEPFEGRPKAEKLYAILAGFGLSPIQFAVRKEFADKYGITSIKDIVNKKVPIRIVTDNPGTSDEYVGRKILEFNGITYDNIKKWGGNVILTGYTDAVQLIQDGHADMAINNVAAPAGPYVEMQLNIPLVFFSLDEASLKYTIDSLAHVPHVIPSGTYKGQDKDIVSAGMYSVFVVNADVPDDVVYSITKIICENETIFRTFAANTRNFTASTAYEGCGIPLHPGSRKYFEEKGYLKK